MLYLLAALIVSSRKTLLINNGEGGVREGDYTFWAVVDTRVPYEIKIYTENS